MDTVNSEVLRKFLSGYPWALLESAIQASPKLKKDLTRGGVRIKNKNKKLILGALEKKWSKNPELQRIFFVQWFNASPYYELLHEFFQSDEHDELLRARGVENECYVLNDEYFRQFVELISPGHIDFFIQLSPIEFTSIQLDELYSLKNDTFDPSRNDEKDSQGNSIDDPHSKNQLNILQSQIKSYKNELKKKDKKIHELESSHLTLNETFKKKKIDVDRYKNKISEIKANHDKKLAEIQTNYDKEIELLNKIKNDSEKKLLEAENVIKKLKKKSDSDNDKINNLIKQLHASKEERERPFHQVISKIDWEELVAAINAPDDVLELLRNIIGTMKADDRPVKDEMQNSLTLFWQQLREKEEKLAHKIFNLDITSINDGKFLEDWPDLVDDFTDLKCSLSARYFLAETIYSLLRQHIENL